MNCQTLENSSEMPQISLRRGEDRVIPDPTDLRRFRDLFAENRGADAVGECEPVENLKGGIRLLVCGGRDHNDPCAVWKALDEFRADREISVLIHGGAKGVDYFASLWVRSLAALRDGPVPRDLRFPANWKKYGKGAGPIRNQQMLNEGAPDIVLAFPGGAGTADMVRRSLAAGLRVINSNTPSPIGARP